MIIYLFLLIVTTTKNNEMKEKQVERGEGNYKKKNKRGNREL